MNSAHCFDWVGYHSRRRPHDIAVANADSPFALTWAELEGRVARLAHLLAGSGQVKRRDRVALLAENDARYFEVQFACIRLGAVFVPLNIRLSPAELRATLDDAGPLVLIHDTGLAALAADVSGPPGGLTLLQWDDSPSSTPYAQVSDASAAAVPAGCNDPDDLAQILYTSGTTGKPKGVLSTNRALAANAVNMAHTSRVCDRDAHALNFVPLFHAGGLNIYCNPVLYWGGRVTTTRAFDAAQALRLLTDDTLGITITNGVLQMFERIAALDGFAQARFPSLRVALFGGFGPSAPRTYARWFGRGFALQLGYGSTELGPMASMHDNPDEEAIARGEYGRPVPLAELRSIDDDGTPLPPGATGEIQVRGPAVTPGYWGQGREAGLTTAGFPSATSASSTDPASCTSPGGWWKGIGPAGRTSTRPRLRRLSWTCPGSWSWPWWGCPIRRGARSGCWSSCPGPGSPSPSTPSAGMPRASWPGSRSRVTCASSTGSRAARRKRWPAPSSGPRSPPSPADG